MAGARHGARGRATANLSVSNLFVCRKNSVARVVAGGLPADFQAVGNVLGKIVVARDEGETLVDRSPDDQAIKRVAMLGYAGQAAGAGGDFPGKRQDAPTGFDDEAGEIFGFGTVKGEFAELRDEPKSRIDS